MLKENKTKKMYAVVFTDKALKGHDLVHDTKKNYLNRFIIEELNDHTGKNKGTADVVLFRNRKEALKARQGVTGFKVIPISVTFEF